MKGFWKVLQGTLMVILLFCYVDFQAEAEQKQTLHNSPYVTFTQDGKAWTTNAGDTDYRWYFEGTTVNSGLSSTLRTLQNGEHYYNIQRRGEIPVGMWKVVDTTGSCIHNSYPDVDNDFHGIAYGREKCLGNYYSGWIAYCADCGEQVTDAMVYMSDAAAETIDYLEMGEENTYYYLCPRCTNLEQGAPLKQHYCKDISANQYKVRYEPNTGAASYGGYMEDSIHMYNNATWYEGELVEAITHLTENTYTRIGYEFVGWNTEPDGSGVVYENGAEIFNLTEADWKNVSTWHRGEYGEGVVVLYAQWRTSSSTLKIDPNGGSYNGSKEITDIVGSYGQYIILTEDAIQPPEGYTVTFETNGGSEVSPIKGTQSFKEWVLMQPFRGRIMEERYFFTAPDGNVDKIKALYERNSIILPETVLEGSNFGGWYYDAEFSQPAGAVGAEIIPAKDMTLYALWVDLKLEAKNNMVANDGKGAVDLSWTQADTENKVYRLYQSRDKENWVQIYSANDISNITSIHKTVLYTGNITNYVVPATGLYTLKVQGAQGGNYERYQGGLGGSIEAQFWLQAGEVLTYNIGGQNGYNGGGLATMYANGGGYSIVTSNRKGTLLVAGGGGGASALGNGNAGGSQASVNAESSNGQSGESGGGGGYWGGSAGEQEIHLHKESCYHNEVLDYTLLRDTGDGYYNLNTWMQTFQSRYGCFAFTCSNCYDLPPMLHGIYTHTKGEGAVLMSFGRVHNENAVISDPSTWFVAPDFSVNYIPTNENREVLIDVLLHGDHDEGAGALDAERSYLNVYNQEGNCIFSKMVSQITREGSYDEIVANLNTSETGILKSAGQIQSARFVEKILLPEGTEGIYFDVYLCQKGASWIKIDVNKVLFSGGSNRTEICGYEEGQVISASPAYGGSNYVNTEYARNYCSQGGVKQGNGCLTIQSDAIGFLEVLELNDVPATDWASPDMISTAKNDIRKEPVGENTINIIWKKPEDGGTIYYHKAETYLMGEEYPLCVSDPPTENMLITGVCGYYVLFDTNAFTTVTQENGDYVHNVEIGRGQEGGSVTYTLSEQSVYLHVAAVDVAGNIGETGHIEVGSVKDVGNHEVEWSLTTEPLVLETGENVYWEAQQNIYYVRSDGRTPFTLHYEAKQNGPASVAYQPNYIIYETDSEMRSVQNLFYLSSDDVREGEVRVEESEIRYSVNGESYLQRYPYSEVLRMDYNRRLSAVHKFVLCQEASGEWIQLFPRAGANAEEGVIVYSNREEDRENGLFLIGDGEAPEITGLEVLENAGIFCDNNWNGEKIGLRVEASDPLSGVGEFYLRVVNLDNSLEYTYEPGADGAIRLEITRQELIFNGDFVITVYAVDHVGNETREVYGATELALEAFVQRMSEDGMEDATVFKAGESGILTIITRGYVDRVEVEFPEAMTTLAPELNQIFSYVASPQYQQEEQVLFMIPLYTPANENYTITIRAYKGGRQQEAEPAFCTIEVGGDVLEEVRTRLR